MCKCAECGGEFKRGKSAEQEFCSSECRVTFNNRRKTRGADLYDLFMTLAYDRKNRKGVWTAMSRMAKAWHEEDKAAGRKSFGSARKVMERHVQHTAMVSKVRVGR